MASILLLVGVIGSLLTLNNSVSNNVNLTSSNASITIKTTKEPENVTYDVSVGNGEANIFDKYSDKAVVGTGENLIKVKTSNGKIIIKI